MGRKQLVAIADGYRESTESWADLLRDAKRRGMRAPVVMVGDGALGMWAALRDVFPETREQRCWVHAAANVLSSLPKSVHPAARRALARDPRRRGPRPRGGGDPAPSRTTFAAKWPKAVAKIVDKPDELLCFFDFPAEHWIHLKTTNPIESTFATVRLRTKVTKGPGSRAAGLAMAFKLIEAAQARWRAVNGPHLVALVRAGATFHNGVLVERYRGGGVTPVRDDAASVKELLTSGVATECHYVTRPEDRPYCQFLAVVRYNTIALCGECDLRRSAVGKGTAPIRLADAATLLELMARRDTCKRAEAALFEAVSSARRSNQPWSAVGAVLGTSRQAAQQRFSSVTECTDAASATTRGRR